MKSRLGSQSTAEDERCMYVCVSTASLLSTLSFALSARAICAYIVVCVCECVLVGHQLPSVELPFRAAILLSELKCFATHSSKNICTHTPTPARTLLQHAKGIEQVEPFESCHVLARRFRD